MAIGRALAFLRARQLPYGEFKTLLGRDRQLSRPAFESSPFTTSFVLYALTYVDRAEAADMIDKAASFLLSEMEFGGVWRYYSTRQHKHARIPPDLDDTSCISFALKQSGRVPPDNAWILRSSRDDQGRFRTWILPTKRNLLNLRFLATRLVGNMQAQRRARKVPTPESEDGRFRIMHIDRNDIDPVVNGNTVLYLGDRACSSAVLDLIAHTIQADLPDWSLYYEDKLSLYHAVARAFLHASPRLGALKDLIVARTLARAKNLGDLNSLQAALSASVLLTFAPDSPVIGDLAQSIRRAQREDGGWNAYSFYKVWGSEELTTGFCLEALARFRRAAGA